MTRLRLPRLAWIGVFAVLLALLAWQVNETRQGRGGDSRSEAAVTVARDQVLDLTTLDSTTVGAKLAAMSRRTTGDFKQQLSGITKTFDDLVKEKQISATGQIDSAAISSISATDASVLIASSASVTTKDAKATSRTYRVRVKLERIDGSWKVNGMEFVQ